MSRPIARTLGALALAAALIGPTATFAAPQTDTPILAVVKKRTDTLAGLSRELRTSAVEKARSWPGAPKLTGQGGTSQSGPSDLELDLICANDWFITWDEDANGDPVLGSFNLHCADIVIPIG